MYVGLHVKYPLFLSDFNDTWIFSTDFRKIFKFQISWKSVQWEPSCSFQTDRTWRCLIVAFRSFANALNSDWRRWRVNEWKVLECLSSCMRFQESSNVLEVSSVFSPISSHVTWSTSSKFIVCGLGLVCWFPGYRFYTQATRRLYKCVLIFGGNTRLQAVVSASECTITTALSIMSRPVEEKFRELLENGIQLTEICACQATKIVTSPKSKTKTSVYLKTDIDGGAV
jgi:hypothetical protein